MEARSNKTFQYVPVLNVLQLLLARIDIVDKLVDHHTTSTSSANANQYGCFQDGDHHKKNHFFFGKDLFPYVFTLTILRFAIHWGRHARSINFVQFTGFSVIYLLAAAQPIP